MDTLVQLSARRRQLVLAICCLSLFITGLDVTIVNVALPSIQHSLHAPVSGLQWTVDAYTLVIACLLMLSGSLADRLGRRRVLQTGLALFSAGSLLCSVAPGLGWLVAFRGLQAVGGSMLNPVAMSIIVNTFTDPKERARATGIWGSVAGLSLAVGPVLGGLLVSGLGWRSIFWINIPVGVAAIAATQRFVPESKAPKGRSLDPAGQALVAVTLGAVTYATIEGPRHGWGSPLILGLFALSLAAAATLIAAEARRREPLLDIRFFRSAPFAGASMIAVAAFATLGGFLFLNTLYLQEVRGYSALQAGLLTVPLAAMIAVFAAVSGRLVGSRGARLPFVLAGAALATGALLLGRLTPHSPLPYLVLAYLVFGVGSGLVTAPVTNTAVSGMPREQAGVAGAIASTSRQIGVSLGVAVTGSIVAAGAGTGAGLSTAAGFTTASHAAWAVLAGCGVVVLLVGLLSTGAWARGTAERNGLRLARDEEVGDDRSITAAS
jgi:EmrB/QacA subfamily drug resistance transporter